MTARKQEITIQQIIKRLESTSGPLPADLIKHLLAQERSEKTLFKYHEKLLGKQVTQVENRLTALNLLHRQNQIADYDYRLEFRRQCRKGGFLIHKINMFRRLRGVGPRRSLRVPPSGGN